MGVAGGRMAVAGEGREMDPNGTWRLGHLFKGESPGRRARPLPDLRAESLADRREAGLRSVMLFVNRFADVVSGEGGEDQRLNRTGEQTQEHGRQGHDQRHKESEHSNH